ncbi:MAG: hypothetical protein FJX57_11320 [Alphaproteobacteria bacterium]|nr:hypothetical protein [Alphaproteobacteria bacterium]
MSQFAFLQREWPEVFAAAAQAEAHRSVFQKCRAIFQCFDALQVATPKDEIDRNTYLLFEIEAGVRADAYGNEDALGGEAEIALPAFASAKSFERFRAKARAFMRANSDHVAVQKLHMNGPLTPADLAECGGDTVVIEHAKATANGLGRFIRTLVGLDRKAAKAAVAGFVGDRTPTADQIEFINLIVDHLTEHSVMQPAALYEPPFTSLTPTGPESLFSATQIEALVSALERVDATAAA